MHIQCRQLLITPIIDEDIFDKKIQLEICKCLYKKRIIFSGAIQKDGYTTKHDQIRITAIYEDRFADVLSVGSTHTLTLKRVPIENLVSISITNNHPIDNEEAKTMTIQDFLDI